MIIREYQPADEAALVELSLRAWAPAFASFEDILGVQIFERVYGAAWQAYQEQTVRRVLADPKARAWVALENGKIVGWVVALLHSAIDGEVDMLAVDPSAAGAGVGTTLVQQATEWLGAAGATLVSIATAGDASHAAARKAYEKSGYQALPLVRYYKAF